MAEQITHKRPLKIKVDKDKRKLLQQYYHLNEPKAEPESQEDSNLEVEHPESETSDEQDIEAPTPIDKPIKQSTLAELVHIHNTLLTKETETNNTIKNTIYENYYDLIKVNKLLSGVVEESRSDVELLKDTIQLLVPTSTSSDKEST